MRITFIPSTQDAKMLRLITVLTFLIPSTLTAAASPYGLWLTQKKGVIVDVYACGDALCGRTVWLKKMKFKDGRDRLDRKNPVEALRTRHWCGIEVISGVKPVSSSEWEGGDIYDPKTGKTFNFDMEQRGDQMKVRGYLGVKMLGKSETWTRTSAGGRNLCSGS